MTIFILKRSLRVTLSYKEIKSLTRETTIGNNGNKMRNKSINTEVEVKIFKVKISKYVLILY